LYEPQKVNNPSDGEGLPAAKGGEKLVNRPFTPVIPGRNPAIS
jgi:hypothetical protein